MTKTEKQLFRITHILHGGEYGIEQGYVVLSFEPIVPETCKDSVFSRLHTIKLHERFDQAVFSGDKKAEVRKNDRDYQKGDIIRFEVVGFERTD